MKIGILGTHGSGKTTLVNDLCAALAGGDRSVAALHEAARLCPYELNKDGSEAGQAWIFAKQLMMEAEAEDFDIVLVDRTPLDQLAYIYWLMDHGQVSADFAFRYLRLASEWMDTYDRLVYVPVESEEIEDDGVRDTDPEYQRDIDRRVFEMMGLITQPIILAKGSREERVRKVLEAIG